MEEVQNEVGNLRQMGVLADRVYQWGIPDWVIGVSPVVLY